jgi:hypothetical protein
VYFFANGFAQCVDMQTAGAGAAIELVGTNESVDTSRYSSVLGWDGTALKAVQ